MDMEKEGWEGGGGRIKLEGGRGRKRKGKGRRKGKMMEMGGERKREEQRTE